jgi:hypothetical protein
MRRVVLLLLAGVVGAIGLMQVAPPPAGAPEFGSPTTDEPGGGAVASPSAWYCPWVESGDIVDSDVIVVSEPTVDIGLTLLHPISNEAPEFFETELVGPGAVAIATGTVLRVGESPAVVEISNGPAAAASMQYADKFISADQCIVSVPKIWYLPGGSTRTGTITQLRLFNPFADDAEVTITAYSEFGIDLVAELDGFDVAGRSWTTIDLEPYLPFRDELALTVTATRGLVIPALVRSDDRGEAMWPGTGPAETWDFPIVTAGGLEPFIAVMSAGGDDIVVAVDIITPEGAIRNAREITIESSVPGVIPLSDLAAPPFGVRVRASAPIGASVIAVVPTADPDEVGGEIPPDEETTTTLDDTTTSAPDGAFITGLAGTVGLARPASEWLVPLDTLPDAETTMWILNAGLEPVSVVYEPLGELEYVLGEPVIVAPESILGVPVEVGIGYFGYRVVADGPVTVAWTIHGQRGVAFASGIAVQ